MTYGKCAYDSLRKRVCALAAGSSSSDRARSDARLSTTDCAAGQSRRKVARVPHASTHATAERVEELLT